MHLKETHMLKYKGYFGDVIFDAESRILFGRVVGLKDVITFQGTTADEIKQACKDSVDV